MSGALGKVHMDTNVEKKSKPPVLTGTQALVLISLISGMKKKEAAQAAGVHPQAVSEMLNQQHFVEALRCSQGKLIDQATGELSNLVKNAVEVITQTLQSSEPALQFKAATYVLDRMLLLAKAKHDIALDILTGHAGNAQPAKTNTVNEALQYLKENHNDQNAGVST